MDLPFTREQFFQVFRAFNEATFPLHVVFQALGAVTLALAWSGKQTYRRLALLALAVFWLFVGIGYHWMFFTPINEAAWGFGALFVLQAGLLSVAAFRLRRENDPRTTASLVIGGLMVAYGWAVYPLVTLFRHGWPNGPFFGVAPCPTTIFTFGILFLMRPPVPKYLLIVPLIWSAIGGSAAIVLDVPQDYGLIVAGAVALSGFRLFRKRPETPTPGS